MRSFNKAADILLLGLHSLAVHKVRSLLTAMGILFGVCSVIAMLAINEGASQESQLALRQMGSDNLLIESLKPPPEESSAAQDRGGALTYGLTLADVRCLRENLPGVVRYVTAHRTVKNAQRGLKLIPAQVLASSPDYLDMARLTLTGGRFVSAADQLRCRNVCVLTAPLSRRLFGHEDPLEQTVRLNGEAFTVVGLVDSPGRTMATVPPETVSNIVIVPDTTDATRFGKYTIFRTGSSSLMEMVEVSQVIFQMADEKAVIDAAAVARSLLARSHDKKDYDITVPLELIEQRRKQRRLWNVMFVAIASISLVVGGIGIMNIMLASVTERTREIGIRRALGGRRRDIITQFLVEAVTLTTVGGLLGIAVGLLAPLAVEHWLKFKTVVSAPTLLIPFLMAVAVGLVSGLYPALRAAKLDPIQALRHE